VNLICDPQVLFLASHKYGLMAYLFQFEVAQKSSLWTRLQLRKDFAKSPPDGE
jgi:hypothetical protein